MNTSSESPVITRQQSCFFRNTFSSKWASVLVVTSLKTCSVWVLDTNLELLAIHCAVSSLSPVSIHICSIKITSVTPNVQILITHKINATLIPAFFSNSRVGLTLSWSLSSTPVRHNSSISRSKLSITLHTIVLRSVVFNLAELYLICIAKQLDYSYKQEKKITAIITTSKSRYCSKDNVFFATTRVRRPSLAKFPHSSTNQSLYWTMLVITTSAPLRKKVISPDSSFWNQT